MEKMNFQEMDKVTGGDNVTKEEYCATAKLIIDNNEGLPESGVKVAESICRDSDAWN